MNELSRLDLLLAQARNGLAPSEAQLQRLAARVVGTPVAQPAAALNGGRWAAFKATGSAGLLAAGLLVTGGFIAGYLSRPQPSLRSEPAPSQAPAAPTSNERPTSCGEVVLARSMM